MYWGVEIEEEDTPKLHKRIWRFKCFDMPLIHLDAIIVLSRPTRRHKYSINDSWNRLDTRHNTMDRTEPPDLIKEEVLKKLNNDLRFD